MCKVLLGINTKHNNETFNSLILSQKEALNSQKDGIGALVVNGSTHERFKALRDYEAVYDDILPLLPTANIVGLHSRQATTGAVTRENIHFFKHKNWVFAHNGYVLKLCTSSYGYGYPYKTQYEFTSPKGIGFTFEDEEDTHANAGEYCQKCKSIGILCQAHWEQAVKDYGGHKLTKKERKQARKAAKRKQQEFADKSDSFLFLTKLTAQDVNTQAIEAAMKQWEFTGVAFLYNVDSQKLFTLSDRNIEMHSDFKTFAILYSYAPQVISYDNRQIFGLPAYTAKDVPVYEIPKGVYEIEWKSALSA